MNKKIVFIGNSIVNGYPFDRSKCFVTLVGQMTGCGVVNKGNNGETTSNILSRFERDVLSADPDAVFILTGTNDFIYGEASPQQAFDNLMRMARMAENHTPAIKPVFLTPLPVDEAMASEKWLVGENINYRYVNDCLKAITELIKASGYEYIDLNAGYGACGQYHDGVHPTEDGYRFIADLISKNMGKIFSI